MQAKNENAVTCSHNIGSLMGKIKQWKSEVNKDNMDMDMFPETAETKYTGIGLKC
jgi:hypothetical protein